MIKIPIVFAVDINMISQTFVSIGSVLEHRRENYKIDFFIMISDEKVQEKGNKYISALMNRFDEFDITYLFINDALFKNVKDTMNGITKAAMYRILLPNYLMQYDKCLYCDSDIFVYGDIVELFKEDLEDNYLAGVLALFDVKNLKEKLGLKKESHYINSGILLMNLKKLREDKMVDVFLNTVNSNISKLFIMQDQDLINVCCNNRIKVLSPRFNVQVSELASISTTVNILYPDDSDHVLAEIRNPFILHFTGEWLKPWKCPCLELARDWWETAGRILSSEEIVKIWDDGERNISEIFFSEMLLKVRDVTDIIIFGFSVLSNQLIDSLICNGINAVRAFCDNDTNKQGLCYNNIFCLSVEEVSKRWKNALYIISVQTRRIEIEEQLIKYGIEKKHIIQYTKKPEALQMLAQGEFRERLLRDDALEQHGKEIE